MSLRQRAYTPQAGLGVFLFRKSCISPRTTTAGQRAWSGPGVSTTPWGGDAPGNVSARDGPLKILLVTGLGGAKVAPAVFQVHL